MSTKASTVALFGLPITNVTMAEAVARVEESIDSGQVCQIATANLDFARNSLRDAKLQEIICDCSMVLADGAPMVWASRLFGRPLEERVTGVDLVPELAALAARRGFGIFLLGSSERSSARAAQLLEERYPGVRIVGRYSPPVAPLATMNDAEILRRLEEAKPDILLVAFGNPKQEYWIHRNRGVLKVPVSIGIGGALDMIAGSLKRAPKWVQNLNLEWLYRMAQEPGRLLPRYVGDATALVRHLPLGLAASRMQPSEGGAGPLGVTVQGSVRIVATPETVTGEMCLALTREAKSAARLEQMLVVDMSRTTRIEADGLGCLLEARRVMLAAGLKIWLAGMSNPVRRVLQYSAMFELFRVAPEPADAVRFAAGNSDADWKAQVSEQRRAASVSAVRVGPKTVKA